MSRGNIFMELSGLCKIAAHFLARGTAFQSVAAARKAVHFKITVHRRYTEQLGTARFFACHHSMRMGPASTNWVMMRATEL